MSVFISKQLTVPSLGKALSDYAVGESVFIPVNGVQTEFLVVQQGKPSADYDASCDGTWLLTKKTYASRMWDATDNDYGNSDIHAWLNSDFLALFDTKLQSKIKQVKIPYTQGTGSGGSVKTGANGLSTKAFLLSNSEVGFSAQSYSNIEGSGLEYFSSNESRIVYSGITGNLCFWSVRSPRTNGTLYYWTINTSGISAYGNVTGGSGGMRPCIILPFNTKFDPDTNEVKA